MSDSAPRIDTLLAMVGASVSSINLHAQCTCEQHLHWVVHVAFLGTVTLYPQFRPLPVEPDLGSPRLFSSLQHLCT